MDKQDIFVYGIGISVILVCSFAVGLAIYNESERYGFCNEINYDNYIDIRDVDGETWIECSKVKIVNNSLVEINDWIRWK